MADSQVTVNRFSWPELLPSLLIFRALPASLNLTVLVLALFAVAATPVGWIGAEKLFVGPELAENPDFAATAEVNRSPWKVVYPKWSEGESMLTVLGNQLRGVELIFKSGVNSIKGVFSLQPGKGRFMYSLTGALWTLLVWSFFGCAITRAALMKYTREEPIGIDDAFDYAIDKFPSCFGGVGIPLFAVFGLTIPIALIGLLMSTNFGAAIGGALWFVVLILSLIIAVIMLGLMFAWPLIVSSVSCEGQDSFDGMSRAYAYVFQRPVHYFVYSLIAILFTGVCWLVGSNVIEGTIRTAHWSSSWGMNISDRYRSVELSDDDEISFVDEGREATTAQDVLDITKREAAFGRDIATPENDDSPDLISNAPASSESGEEQESVSSQGSVEFGKRMIKFWDGFARTLGAAFLYGLFWCVAAAVYLLLRKDLDDTETDEIFMVDERRTYELPPLKDDASGVPQVDEDAVLPAKVDPPDSASSDDDS